MSGDITGAPAPKSRDTTLALVFVAVWLAAAALAGALGIWPAIGGAAIALGIGALLFDRSSQVALLRPSPKFILLGAAAGSLMAAATYLIYPVLGHLLPFIATDTVQLYAAFRAPSPAVASIALVPVIVGEELVWRGVVQASLVRRMGPWRGVVLAGVVYALVHAPLGSPVLVAVALFCGLCWGALRATTASLVPALVAHLLWDVLVLLLLPLESR